MKEASQAVRAFTKDVEASEMKIMQTTVRFDQLRRATRFEEGFGLAPDQAGLASALMLMLAREDSVKGQLELTRMLRQELESGNVALGDMADKDFKFLTSLDDMEAALTRANSQLRQSAFSDFEANAHLAFAGATASAQKMVVEVGNWLDNQMPSILDRAKDRIMSVSNAFFRMYDETVGNSWVPDMVLAIKDWFGKLDGWMVKPAKEATDEVSKHFEDMSDGPAVNLGSVIESSMSRGFTSMLDGTKSAKEAFRDMAKSIISSLYDVLVVQQLVGSFSKGGGGILGSLFGIFGGISGKRESGGPVTSGKAYLVGESGPELMVPSRNSHIVPNGGSGGTGQIVVHQTINVTTGVQQTVRSEITALMPQIADSAKAAVLDARRRGGAFRGAF
jgi:hypothetical protein